MQHENMTTLTNTSPVDNMALVGKKVQPVVEEANALVVLSDSQCDTAGQRIKGMKALIKQIKEDFADSKQQAFEAHRAVCRQEEGHITHVKSAIDILTTKINVFKKQQEALARQEAEAAAVKAEAARKRKINIAEQKMNNILSQIEGKKHQINRLEMLIAMGDCSVEEAEVYQHQLDLMTASVEQKAGEAERLSATATDEPIANPAVIPVKPAKVDGLRRQEKWAATVQDPMALIKAIAAGMVEPGVIKAWDLTYIQGLRKKGRKLPGISYEDKSGYV